MPFARGLNLIQSVLSQREGINLESPIGSPDGALPSFKSNRKGIKAQEHPLLSENHQSLIPEFSHPHPNQPTQLYHFIFEHPSLYLAAAIQDYYISRQGIPFLYYPQHTTQRTFSINYLFPFLTTYLPSLKSILSENIPFLRFLPKMTQKRNISDESNAGEGGLTYANYDGMPLLDFLHCVHSNI